MSGSKPCKDGVGGLEPIYGVRLLSVDAPANGLAWTNEHLTVQVNKA